MILQDLKKKNLYVKRLLLNMIQAVIWYLGKYSLLTEEEAVDGTGSPWRQNCWLNYT